MGDLAEHDDYSRKVIHATVCKPGALALRAFCVHHGVTVTAFLDGLGHTLAPLVAMPAAELREAAPILLGALLRARQIDADRRSREPSQFKQ